MSAKVEGRPAARHDEKEKKIHAGLRNFLNEFSFYDIFLGEFERNADSQKLCDRSIPYNEQRLKEDPGHFYLDMTKSNYLAMLYRKANNRTKAEEQNKATLSKDPKNIRALYLRVEIFKEKKDYQIAGQTLSQLKAAAKDPFCMLNAKAEIVLNYPDFGPAYYQTSVEILEDVLEELNSSPEIRYKMPAGRLIKWKYDLAHTYDKVMNKGNVQTYWEGIRPETSFLFGRIKELLREVIDSSDAFYSPKSWVDLADAFKKYEERSPGKGKEMKFLPGRMKVNDCFEEALKLGPNDPYVLERCGRHWRQRATDKKGLYKAIELLKRCIDVNEFSDIAYHHMGLAYRALWLIKENHREKWLYINRTKKYEEKKSMRNQRNFSQKQNQTKWDHKKYNAGGYGSKNAKHDRSGQESVTTSNSFTIGTGNSRGQTGDELSEKSGIDTSQCQGGNLSSNLQSTFLSAAAGTLTDEEVLDSGYVEGQTSSLSSTANLEGINESEDGTDHVTDAGKNQSSMSDLQSPPINGTNESEFCASSNERNHVHKRNRIVSSGSDSSEGQNSSLSEKTQPTEVLYHRKEDQPSTGQRRTIPPKHPKLENEVPKHYNRQGDYHDRLRTANPVAIDPRHPDLLQSRKCFKKASDIRQGSSGKYLIDLARTYISSRDFDRAKQIFQDCDSKSMNDSDGSYLYEQWGLFLEESKEEDLEKVKNIYRTSVKCSASARQRSKVAFNRLKSIIDEQIKKNPDDVILKKEQLILRTTIQDTVGAENLWNNMTSDKCLPLIWELIGMYHGRARPTDATAGFSYLEILAKENKLQEVDEEESDEDIVRIWQERAKQVIEIAQIRVKNGGNAKSTLSTVYKWLLALTSKDVNLVEDPQEAMKIRIVAPSDESPEVGLVEEILGEVVGIRYRKEYRSGSDDILPGSIIADEILSDLRAAHCAIVVLQSAGNANDEQAILHLLKVALNDPDHKPRRVCRAVSKRSPIIQDDRLSTLPQWDLDAAGEVSDIASKTDLVINLLKVLFLQDLPQFFVCP